MSTPNYPKTEELQQKELEAFKSIFEMIEALEKRIQAIESWKKSIIFVEEKSE